MRYEVIKVSRITGRVLKIMARDAPNPTIAEDWTRGYREDCRFNRSWRVGYTWREQKR